MKPIRLKNKQASRRRLSNRSALSTSTERPRLSVHRTSKHIYAQVIDDKNGRTLAACSSTSKVFLASAEGKGKSECAALVGLEIAKRATEAGVSKVAFDRGSFKYHGRVKALADAAREGGLSF
jgi:large subunit ribosomal protein L18